MKPLSDNEERKHRQRDLDQKERGIANEAFAVAMAAAVLLVLAGIGGLAWLWGALKL